MLLYVACLHTVTHPCDNQPLTQKEGNYKYRSDATAIFFFFFAVACVAATIIQGQLLFEGGVYFF